MRRHLTPPPPCCTTRQGTAHGAESALWPSPRWTSRPKTTPEPTGWPWRSRLLPARLRRAQRTDGPCPGRRDSLPRFLVHRVAAVPCIRSRRRLDRRCLRARGLSSPDPEVRLHRGARDFSAIGTNVLDGCCPYNSEADDDTHGGWSSPFSMAVDNSGGNDDGDIFVANGGGVEVFLPSGQYLARMPNGGGTCGVAVSPSGRLRFAGANQNGGTVTKFIPGLHDRPDEWQPRSELRDLRSEQLQYRGRLGRRRLRRHRDRLPDNQPGQPAEEVQVEPLQHRQPDRQDGRPEQHHLRDRSFERRRLRRRGHRRCPLRLNRKRVGVVRRRGPRTFGGIGFNPTSGTAYVSDLFSGVYIYTAQDTPDITGVSATAGQTTAAVSAHLEPRRLGIDHRMRGRIRNRRHLRVERSLFPGNPSGLRRADRRQCGSLRRTAVETTYHYRVDATNANGTHRGLDQTFTTHAVRNVATDPPTNVTQTNATLNGSFNGDGSDTHYYFEWGTDTSVTGIRPPPLPEPTRARHGTNFGIGRHKRPLRLRPGLPRYHYRLVATNSVGTTFGPDRVFNSAPEPPPSSAARRPQTSLQRAPGSRRASTPGWAIRPMSSSTAWTRRTAPQTDMSPSIGSDDTAHAVTSVLGGLTPGTTYHFRAVAINFGGTTPGPDVTFTTPGLRMWMRPRPPI